MSDSVQPHRWQPTRLPHPWDSPGKNTGVGCYFLLQCIKVKSEREVSQSCLTLSDPMDYSLPGSSMGFSRQEYCSGVPLPSPNIWMISLNLTFKSNSIVHSINKHRNTTINMLIEHIDLRLHQGDFPGGPVVGDLTCLVAKRKKTASRTHSKQYLIQQGNNRNIKLRLASTQGKDALISPTI